MRSGTTPKTERSSACSRPRSSSGDSRSCRLGVGCGDVGGGGMDVGSTRWRYELGGRRWEVGRKEVRGGKYEVEVRGGRCEVGGVRGGR